MNVHRSPHLRARIRHDSRGFTLIEVLIAVVLSAMVAGVIVAGLVTALNIARSTTDQVGDSNDAGLISSFLVRDAQSAGGIDPTTALPDASLGVSTNPSDADAIACSPSPAAVMVRFSWVDRTSMSAQTRVVVTYALANGQLTRRICATNNPSVDVMLGSNIKSALATCKPATAFCTGHPTSVSLALEGKGTGAPLNYTLTASLRSAPSLLTIIRPTELLAGRRLVPYASSVGTTIGASTLTTWTATGLPTGLSIDPLSGMVWGAPNPVGTFPVTATVTLTVTDTLFATVATRQYPIIIHAPPVAADDTYALVEDTPLTIAVPGVLAAPDGHLEGSALTATLASGVSHGTLALNVNGSFTYTPEPNWNGSDSFKYMANDGLLNSTAGTVTLTVAAVNDAPVNQVPVGQETPKNVPEVFSNASNRIAIGDVDAGGNPMQVQLAVNTGTLSLPSATGLTAPTGSGTAAVTLKGTLANINLSLVNLTFTPPSNFTGVATLTMVTTDLGSTGGAAQTDTDPVSINVTSLGIFAASQDVGTVGFAGSSVYTSPAYTVKGSGWDIWENKDGFQFIYRQMTGNGSLTARVVSEAVTYPDGTNQNPSCYKAAGQQQPCISVAKAGVMFRQNLSSGSAIDAMVGVTRGNGSEFIYRKTAGATTAAATPGDSLHVPYWVRLTRTADQVTAWISSDGATWTQRGVTQTIALGSPMYVGLAVSAVNQLSGDDPDHKLNTATFDSVSISTPPTAVNDSYTVNQYTTLDVPASSGVLANDSDPESNILTVKPGSGPAHGTLSLNGVGSFTYTPTPAYSGPDSFTYSANDGVFDSAATVTIIVNPVPNGTPTFTKGADQSIRTNLGAQTVGGWATAISTGSAASDAGQLVDFIVTNTNNALFSVQPSISADGTLSYAPAAAVNAVPAKGTATVTVTIHDNGGTTNGGIDTSAPQTFTITILAPPVLTVTRAGLVYTENDPPLLLDSGITVTDADSTTLASATVTIAGGYVNGEDVLAFANQNSISGTWTAASGVLALTGTTTIANYQTALRSITYTNSSDNPTTATRTLTFAASDGVVNSTTVGRTMTITPVNDAPVNSVPGVQATVTTVAEVFSTGNGNLISISDVDAGASPLQVQLVGSNGAATLSGLAGLVFTTGDGTADPTMTFSGTLADINAALAGLSFTPNAAFTGTANLEIKTSDQFTGAGGALTDDDNVTITVESSACPATIAGWLGQYYANATLTGTPVLCHDDASINFVWGVNAPHPAMPKDNFSARWTKTQNFAAGYYTFTAGSNDGSRVFVDGVKIPELDKWMAKGYSTFTGTVFLADGSHTIVMEYYEQGGDAAATLTWVASTPPSCSIAANGWLGQYFSNTSLTGPPAECRDDATINFSWGNGAPITGMLPNGFSARWTKTQTFTAGSYRFTLGTDDGGRLYIDGVLVPEVSSWGDHSYPTPQPSVVKSMTAGSHTMVVEYYENGGGAQATFVITNPPPAPTLTFSAFTNTYWSGTGSTVFYRSAASSGSFTTTASSTDVTSGIASYGFPALGTNWTSTPGASGVNTYSWTGAPAAPGTQNVTATNGAGLPSAGSPFTLAVDNTPPAVGTVTYPNGTQSATSVSVSFATGTDVGSGVGTRLLQRQSAALSGSACGAFTGFATLANGTNPTSPVTDTVTIGQCYKYQYVVYDNVGNFDTATSSNTVKVSKSYYTTITETAGLLSYWRLGESSGSTAIDSAATDPNNGTYPIRPTRGVGGAITDDSDTAARFNGTDDYGSVTRQIADDFSIEFWFKSTQTFGATCTSWWQGAGLVDAEVGGVANDFGVSLCAGKVVAGVGNPDRSIFSAAAYNTGAWHHVVFTRTRSSGALRLYVDGILVGSTTSANTGSLTSATDINFGRIQTGGNYFAGTLDEIAVYDKVLDQATVTAHYYAG